MEIRKAKASDLEAVCAIYDCAKQALRDAGIDQWQDGYPNGESFLEDVSRGFGVVLEDGGTVIATAAAYIGHEPTYDVLYGGEWLNSATEYGLIHRIAVLPQKKRGGVASSVFRYIDSICKENGVQSARCDTHKDNAAMQKTLAKNGYSYRGVIRLENGDERIAFEKIFG